MGKETVAVIHYMDGTEKAMNAYSLNTMMQMIEHCDKKGFSYYVCLTKLDTIIPVRSHTSFTESLTPSEYVRKSEQPKQLHRALQDVTRIDKIHHPPNRDEVLKKYKEV